ncbi:tetracycline resistance efflux system leader peptide [Moritella sp. Urea-trap-13]
MKCSKLNRVTLVKVSAVI